MKRLYLFKIYLRNYERQFRAFLAESEEAAWVEIAKVDDCRKNVELVDSADASSYVECFQDVG